MKWFRFSGFVFDFQADSSSRGGYIKTWTERLHQHHPTVHQQNWYTKLSCLLLSLPTSEFVFKYVTNVMYSLRYTKPSCIEKLPLVFEVRRKIQTKLIHPVYLIENGEI